MKFFNVVSMVFIILISVIGCGNVSKDDEQMKLTFFDPGAAGVTDNHNFDISAAFTENGIVLSQNSDGDIINTIPIEYDVYQLFIDMLDPENGYLLYCSSPACGQMMKFLYTTNDRWRTCSQKNISDKIDGYPTSFSVRSSEHFYIGTQLRSNGYLFETTDSGEQWTSVAVDTGIDTCSYGYVPVFEEDDGIIYALLKSDGSYLLYQSNDRQAAWEKVGTFVLDASIDQFFDDKGSLYIIDMDGGKYLIEPKA